MLSQTDNLIDMLYSSVQTQSNKDAVVWDDQPTSYECLWLACTQFAALLQDHGVGSGDRVILQLSNSAEFFHAYYGVLMCRAVAVPIFHGSSPARLATLVNLSGATTIVTEHSDITLLLEELKPHLEGPAPVIVDLRGPRPNRSVSERPAQDDLAMLQYTSGTTGNPKGVMLTHGNLLANIRQMIPAAQFEPEDVFVSWLPVYHDMGLITMTMCPFYLGAKLVLLPISPKPFTWFSAIERHRGTMTASPDFGYRFATKFTRRSKYDLRSLRRALIAAEPVRASTIERFEEKFDLNGVLKPGYGLAEASVAASFWHMDRQDRLIDEEGHVSAGKSIPGMEIAIEGTAEPYVQGEILIKGPNCTQGYYRNPEATAALKGPNGFLRTGDVGYLDSEGHLFIVGRAKNIIIRAGRNLAPREIEEVAEEVPGVRLAAAIGVDAGGIEGEQIILFCEWERGRASDDDQAELVRQLQQHTHENLGYRPDKVMLVKPQSIPRTYNGKLQYSALKAEYLKNKRHIHD